ncbi:MAG: TIGR00341 family protein [Desulfobacca sp.]|uniref:TIGR00341 family protein n=1 Tax=Desulfobacca sp. TaxID=2067990 RepID=UPI00404B2F45
MALRLLETVLPVDHLAVVDAMLQEKPVVNIWYDQISKQQVLLKILLQAEETEHLMDRLAEKFGTEPWFRLVLLPVTASMPRVEEPEEAATADAEPREAAKKKPERISREELYHNIQEMASLTRIYLGMVFLSTVVAATGLLNNNVAVIIGAMVIAPLLGPIIAQAMATTLGDFTLARLAIRTNLTGLSLALLLSIGLGLLLTVSPYGPEIASRTNIGLGDIAVALASGGAGALAFTAGAPTVLVGVMVAVALLPPLATLGLLLGSGYLLPALGAGLLLLTNIICVNLAAVVVFWVQGVRPTTWWEEKQARRATLISISTCVGLLVILVLALLLAQHVREMIFYFL